MACTSLGASGGASAWPLPARLMRRSVAPPPYTALSWPGIWASFRAPAALVVAGRLGAGFGFAVVVARPTFGMNASSGIVHAFSSWTSWCAEEPHPAASTARASAAIRRTPGRLSRAGRLESQLGPLDLRAAHALEDPLDLVGRDREDRETLEDLDVADGLAV